ncbi:SPOR domain-containing protein [Alkalimarinus sediminis]|uniref:SPOR domain-containing protein n=1 Tax=Alkalimarinus sediminis TaxID=1632866 RepID=A0A9E8HL80_9ALTE|nr:SPOR domain-containing protein [Alkalimarinus sediminis]UZW75387.1 hypothetical protein NNL22_01925 [Alkalimarinus sediminis]
MRWIFLTLVLLNVLFAALELYAGIGGKGGEGLRYKAIEGSGRLLLLRELESPGAKVASPNVEVVDRLCMLAGPLRERGMAKSMISGLERYGVSGDIVVQTISKAPNYWVYLEPFETRKAAIAKLKSLQIAKVDSYLITQGELANGISLGVFENIDSARRMLERRQGQGYDVKVTELSKTDFEYWVSIDGEYSSELDKKVTKIMDELEISFGKRQIFCKSVASENKLP